jgi:DUF1365 family protein
MFPKKNLFRYSAYMFYLDLDEIDELAKNFSLFSNNKFNLFSFYDSDHFTFTDRHSDSYRKIAKEKMNYNEENYKGLSTKQKIILLAKESELDFIPHKIYLLTTLRVMGYVFNPVSFYFCFDEHGVFRALLSEVNNTFHDQKMYIAGSEHLENGFYLSKQIKNYYISPFTKFDNRLSWRFKLPEEDLFIEINSFKGSDLEVSTSLSGSSLKFSNKNLLNLFIRYPFYTILVIGRIHFQALKLLFKKVPFWKKTSADEAIIQNLSK